MCMILRGFTKRTAVLLLVLLCLQLSVLQVCGWCMTMDGTNQSITIPVQQWQTLKTELTALNNELIQCQQELTMLKKPSEQLLTELTQAQNLQKKLQQELAECRADLTVLSNAVAEYKTLLQTLKEQIAKERKTHKRQVWQNRFWCLLIGAGIGFAIH